MISVDLIQTCTYSMIVYKGQEIDWHPQSDSLGVSPFKVDSIQLPTFVSSPRCLVNDLRHELALLGCFTTLSRNLLLNVTVHLKLPKYYLPLLITYIYLPHRKSMMSSMPPSFPLIEKLTRMDRTSPCYGPTSGTTHLMDLVNFSLFILSNHFRL